MKVFDREMKMTARCTACDQRFPLKIERSADSAAHKYKNKYKNQLK